MKRLLLIITLLLFNRLAFAQWSVGAYGGVSSTTIDRSQAGRIDETYSSLLGHNFGAKATYAVNPWFAIRAELNVMQRNHRLQRHLDYLSPVYTDHVNTYLTLPLMADFSFGAERLRGHLLLGGFAGYWLHRRVKGITYGMTDYEVFFNDFDNKLDFMDTDRRFDAGLAGGITLSYCLSSHFTLSLDGLLYYDLVSHHKGYPQMQDYRYLTTSTLTLGIMYHISRKVQQ